MALADRDYMRDDEPPQWWGGPSPRRWSHPVTTTLVLVTVAVFISQFFIGDRELGWFGLYPPAFWHGAVWQLLTFQFLHGSGVITAQTLFGALTHILFNLVGLWSLGRALEPRLGGRRLLVLYLGSGMAGGLLHAVLGGLAPELFGYQCVVGASAGVCGLLAAFAMLEPEADMLWFFVPMKARTMYKILVIVAAVFAMVFRDTTVAHVAHLGGLLAGALFIRWRSPWGRRRVRTYEDLDRPNWVSKLPVPREPEPAEPAEFISREVDPILDKISAHGLQSLTEAERKTLESARKKMERR